MLLPEAEALKVLAVHVVARHSYGLEYAQVLPGTIFLLVEQKQRNVQSNRLGDYHCSAGHGGSCNMATTQILVS